MENSYLLVVDFHAQSVLIFAVTAIALSISVVARNPKNLLNQTFAWFMTVLGGWAASEFLYSLTGYLGFYGAHLYLSLMIAPVIIRFLRIFTRLDTRFLKTSFFLSLVVGAIGALLLTMRFSIQSLWSFLWVESFARWTPTLLVPVMFYLIYRDLVYRSKDSASHTNVGLGRRSGMLVGSLILLLAVLPQFQAGVISGIAMDFMCIYFFLLSEGVNQQRLLNVNALLQKLLQVLSLSVVFTIVYSILVSWTQDRPGLFFLNSFVASVVILTIYDPARRVILVVLNRILYTQIGRVEQSVRDALRRVPGLLDMGALTQLILELLGQTLVLESATVYLLRSDGVRFRRFRGFKDDHNQTRELVSNHSLVTYLHGLTSKKEVPILLDSLLEIELERATQEEIKEKYESLLSSLKNFPANIMIPFFSDRKLMGFVVLQSQLPPQPWGQNWGVLSMLYPFFQEVGRALNSMDIYARIRERDRLAALGEMSAGLAHEIRNPLGAIKGAVQLLSQKREIDVKLIEIIEEEVSRLNYVVNQFLTYSRPVATEMTRANIVLILKRILELFSTQEYKGVQIEFFSGGYEKHPQAEIRCHPDALKQVFHNLIRNALQAVQRRLARQGGQSGVVKIGIHPFPNSEKPKEWVIFVEDNGVGIPKETLDKIFIPFFTTSTGGTGLGLSISSRIIEAHNGRIDVYSEEDKLTRFTVSLPVEDQ